MAFKNTYVRQPLVSENTFRSRRPDDARLPRFSETERLLPRPHWHGHDAAISCYWKAWELAFRNLRKPTKKNGFISNYIDTAYNNNLFMWDSAFICMFARYGSRAFAFQRTLDNFYAKQHPDGFICREINGKDGTDCFHRYDPVSTGPNLLPWSEWEYFLNTGDTARLETVFAPLVAFYQWMKQYRTWPDGTYWASGWASGMDNQPRLPAQYNMNFSHGHMVWLDTCLQQILTGRILLQIGEVLERWQEIEEVEDECNALTRVVNDQLWDERSAFYYDRFASGNRGTTMSIGAYWALLAGVVPPERLERFVAHLEDADEFNRPHRVPSLAASDAKYQPLGRYWQGGVWAPTNYMVLRGLVRAGKDALAHDIAMNHLKNVVKVFEETGTLWENYAPEHVRPAKPAKPDFVGWTGLTPIAVLLEHVFGLQPDVPGGVLRWDIRLLEEHGVSRYPFGRKGKLTLKCARRSSPKERPVVEIRSNVPISVEIQWSGGKERLDKVRNNG
jgi:hypothetical protein